MEMYIYFEMKRVPTYITPPVCTHGLRTSILIKKNIIALYILGQTPVVI